MGIDVIIQIVSVLGPPPLENVIKRGSFQVSRKETLGGFASKCLLQQAAPA